MNAFEYEGQVLPVFPLQLVLYPGTSLPLRLFEPRYLDMAQRCMNEDLPFVIVSLDDERTIAKVGTAAKISERAEIEDGNLLVKTHGGQRVQLGTLTIGDKGLVSAPVYAKPLADIAIDDSNRACADLLKRFIAQIGTERFAAPFLYDDAGWVGFRLAEILPLRLKVKQMLLELDNATERLGVIQRFLIENKLIDVKE